MADETPPDVVDLQGQRQVDWLRATRDDFDGYEDPEDAPDADADADADADDDE